MKGKLLNEEAKQLIKNVVYEMIENRELVIEGNIPDSDDNYRELNIVIKKGDSDDDILQTNSNTFDVVNRINYDEY